MKAAQICAVTNGADTRIALKAALEEIERLRGLPKEGLFGKYIIHKADGSPVDPNADYFVLRLDTDPIARRAALEYSYFVYSHLGDGKLAKGLQERIAKYDPKLEDCIALQYVGLRKSELVERCEAQVKRIAELQSLNEDLMVNGNSLRERAQKAEARIADLVKTLQVEKSAHDETKYANSEAANQAFSRIAKQRAALKKLGKAKRARGEALVEERAGQINVSSNIINLSPKDRWLTALDEAREQLRREGKL